MLDHVSEDLLADARITAVGLLMEACGGLVTRLAAQLADHGLAPIEFEILLRLGRSPDRLLRMTDLSLQTSLTSSGVTRVVDRLERDRLVVRQACSSDRRISYVVLTEQGKSRLVEVLPGHVELIERYLTGLLGPAELDGMLRSLRIVRDEVRPEATSGAGDPVVPRDQLAAR
jgi:MarR family transcriptional regulator, 2-MHQ and catechol-resistance regulon repressor